MTRFKIRTEREEFWYGTGLPEQYVDLSEFKDRQAAQAVVAAMAAEAAAQEITIGAEVGDLVATTTPGQPWVSLNVGDAVQAPTMADPTVFGSERIVDLAWELLESGRVRCNPTLTAREELEAIRQRRLIERVGPGGLNGKTRGTSVPATLPESLPGGVLEEYEVCSWNQVAGDEAVFVGVCPKPFVVAKRTRPIRFVVTRDPAPGTTVVEILVNGVAKHVLSAPPGVTEYQGFMGGFTIYPADLVTPSVTAAGSGDQNLTVSVYGTDAL